MKDGILISLDLPTGKGKKAGVLEKKLPLFIRCLFLLRRLVNSILRFEQLFRYETAWAWTKPEKREEITIALYGRQNSYHPGEKLFKQGLLPWEEEMLAHPLFPKRGRILVGASGGGREVAALAQRGFDVVAFEPSLPQLEAAKEALASQPNVWMTQASYRDFIQEMEEKSGPLAEKLRNTSPDAIIMGWGSIIHVTEEKERIELLNAFRHIAPRAPVLVSFLPWKSYPEGIIERYLRPSLRKFYRMLGASHRAGPGDIFEFGFMHYLTQAEMETLARNCGYQIAHWEEWNESFALLVPEGSGSD